MFKKISLTLVALISACISISAAASHEVRSYYRGDGTYVEQHRSMDPYESRDSGWSYHHDQLVPRDNNY